MSQVQTALNSQQTVASSCQQPELMESLDVVRGQQTCISDQLESLSDRVYDVKANVAGYTTDNTNSDQTGRLRLPSGHNLVYN